MPNIGEEDEAKRKRNRGKGKAGDAKDAGSKGEKGKGKEKGDAKGAGKGQAKGALEEDANSKKRRLRNRVYRGQARTYIRDARTALLAEDLDEARASTLKAVKALDKAAEKGVLHKNNASRRKSRLMKQLAALEKQAA